MARTPEASRYPQPWSWVGVTALVLAACIGGGWLAGTVLLAVGQVDPDDAQLGQLLNGIGQVLAGALAAYLGFHTALLGRKGAAIDSRHTQVNDPQP